MNALQSFNRKNGQCPVLDLLRTLKVATKQKNEIIF